MKININCIFFTKHKINFKLIPVVREYTYMYWKKKLINFKKLQLAILTYCICKM